MLPMGPAFPLQNTPVPGSVLFSYVTLSSKASGVFQGERSLTGEVRFQEI